MNRTSPWPFSWSARVSSAKIWASSKARTTDLAWHWLNTNVSRITPFLTLPFLSLNILSLFSCICPGPYFVGAIRLCLTGPPMISTDGKYTLQRLDHCELHSTPNHTLSRNPTALVKLTKAINRTKGMGTEDDVTYSGIWFSSLTIPTLTDIRLLERHGEFFRYLSSDMRVVVEMTESEFYIKNVQEPISRAYEIIFKTVLFSSKSFIIEEEEEEDGSFLSLDFSVMFRCPRFVCSDSAMDSSPVESTHQRKEAQSRTTARSWPLCCLDENTRQEKSLIIAIDGCWSFVMCVVRLCQSCFCRLPFSSSLFHLCCQRIANLDLCRAFRKASITHSHQDWRPGKVCVNVISVFSNCAVMFQWIFERFPLTLPGTNKTLLPSGDDRKPEGDVFARTTRVRSDAKRVCCRYSQLWVFDQPLWESLAWRSTCPPQWFVVPLFEFVTSVMHQHEWTSDSRRAWDTVAARTAADMFTSLVFSYLLSMTATLTGRDFLLGLLLEWTLMDDGQDLKPQCDTNERNETNR